MGKYEKAKLIFKKNGYNLIGPYTNCYTKCECQCVNCKTTVFLELHHIQNRGRCRKCKDLEIVSFFEKNNCKLISEPSRSKKMQFICSCGNESAIRWHNFKNGERCRKCGTIKIRNSNLDNKRIKENIHKYFEDMGCKLLENEYVNQKTPMRYICECGNESIITWKNFKIGHRCNLCASKKIKKRFIPYGPFHSNWNPDRDKVKLNKEIRSKIKHAIRRVFRISNKKKIEKIFNILGYTKEDLINHITSNTNWEKIKTDWELDHRFPIKAFVDYDIYDEKIINALDNLQPLSKKDNRTKNDKYDYEEFEKWLLSKNIKFNPKNG